MPDRPRSEALAPAEAAFVQGRPHEALGLLGDAAREGLDGDVLADAAAILFRTHGAAAAGGVLALGDALGGADRDALQGNREDLERHAVQRLLPEVMGRIAFYALFPREEGNVDPERWPDGKPTRSPEDTVGTVRYICEHAGELEWIHDRLDVESQEVLAARLTFLALDHERAKLGPSLEELEGLVAEAREKLVVEADVRELGYLDSVAGRDPIRSHRFDLRPIGFPIDIETSMFGVQGTFQLQQYRCPHEPAVHLRPGDVALDGGGYLGETALYFAHEVGPEGRVVTFEFEEGALGILRENLAANPELSGRIAVSEHALWHTPGEELSILVSGPGTTVKAAEPGEQTVRTESVDAMVQRGDLDRVDFLKLDIEGAESEALTGAEQTLRRFRPRLAIAAYHHFDDIWALARQIDRLDLGYRFALAHFTNHAEETVLYAWVPEAA